MNNIERTQQMASPFLAPIEEPEEPAMKMAYDMARQQFGKAYAGKSFQRADAPEFGQFGAKISELDQKLTLPKEAALLIRQHVANNNVCLFCIDIAAHSL